MRNDIKKIDNVTKEMEVNNELYYDMLDELFDSVFDFYYSFAVVYFQLWRRTIYLLELQ